MVPTLSATNRKKAMCYKANPSLFFSVTVIVDRTLSLHFVKPSHYFSILFESHLHSEFKGSSNWLIGKSDYICNYIDTYSKLMRLLHCELTPQNLDNYLCDCIMPLWAKCQHKRWAIGGLRFCTDSCTHESFIALWLDSDTFCPPSALQNNRPCFGEELLKRKIYSRQLDEKVREQIHSVSSAAVTMHIEEAGFQASKCVDFKMSVWEYRQTPPTPPPPASLG